ncbi:MAG: S-layer homology domain-containing protein [Clostridia bacterium]|nr:S-layer homology domain-containing protein [Clostridia bacterium]
MRVEVYQETVHGRRKKCKTEFKGVVGKVLLSSMALAIAVGSFSIQAYAASISTVPENPTAIMVEFRTHEAAISAMVNTLNALEELKGKGLVTNEGLRELAVTITCLEKAGQATTQVESLLNRAENLIKDLKLSETKTVQVAIDMARASLFGTSYTAQSRATARTFPDVVKGAWYYDTVMKMTNSGIITGFPDGTFKPNNTISYAEYLALLVRTTGAKSSYVAGDGDAWYAGAVSASYENNILKSGEVFDFTKPISRAEAAMFTERAVQEVLGEASLNTDDIENLIKDFSKIDGTKYEYYVLQQYAKGIVVGDGAGNFNPTSSLTRAEASTIILRTTEKDGRRDMSTVNTKTEVKVENDLVITEGMYAGRMRTAPSTEYDLKALSSARFYKENGKMYVSINLPELPDGFEWDWYVAAYDSKGEYVYSTTRRMTEGKEGQQVIEVHSEYEGKTTSDIDMAILEIAVVNEDKESMVSHKLSTDADGEVLRQSSTNSSDASWEKFDTTHIFNW